MLANKKRKKPSVFGKVNDNLIRQKEKRYDEERVALTKFKEKLRGSDEGTPWEPGLPNDVQIRYLIQPTKEERSNGKNPKWLKTPNYHRKMQAGIWIKHGKAYRIYKVLHSNPTKLSAENVANLQSETQSVYDPIPQNEVKSVRLEGKTLTFALSCLSIDIALGDRFALSAQIKYQKKGESGKAFFRSGAVSYVENFDEMRHFKTMNSCLIDGLSSRIRAYLADKELTFTNHKDMKQIYSGLSKKTAPILAKYGIDYIENATAMRLANMVLDSSGYRSLQGAKAFKDVRVISDYEKILQFYMPLNQLSSKLDKQEITKVVLFLTYTKIARIKSGKG